MPDKAGWPASATLRDQGNTPSGSQPKRWLGLVRCSRRRPRVRIVNVSSREASLTDLRDGMPGYHVSGGRPIADGPTGGFFQDHQHLPW